MTNRALSAYYEYRAMSDYGTEEEKLAYRTRMIETMIASCSKTIEYYQKMLDEERNKLEELGKERENLGVQNNGQ